MKTRHLMTLAAVIAFAAMIIVSGCKKEEPAAPHEHEAAAMTEQAVSAAAQIEQKVCPIMPDMKINPDVFTEYQGKKVYFCCPDCKAKFEAEPEKYLSKLPQFQK